MKAVRKQLGSLMLLLSCAAAQNAGTTMVQNVRTAPEGGGQRVEITLSAPAIPSVETAENPARILLDFPDTSCDDKTKSLSVNENGVRRVRTGQHSTTPMVTRVVIDLDQSHPYTLKAEGNRVILMVGPAENARRHSQGAPVAATSGNLIGVFRRKEESAPPIFEDDTASTPVPVASPTTGPAFDPSANASATGTNPAPPPPVAPAPANAHVTALAESSAQPSFDRNQVATAAKPPMPSATPPQGAATPSEAAVSAPIIAKNEAPTPARTTPTLAPVAASPATPKIEETPAATANSEGAPANNADAAAEPAPAVGGTAAAVPTATLIARSDDPSLRTVFKMKYVAEGVAYLDGGGSQGLKEGMKLEILEMNVP